MWDIPETNKEGRAFIVVIIVFLVLAWISFSLRLWARKITRASLDASDYFCFAGLLLSVGVTVIVWAAFAHGWGDDITRFTLDDALFSAKIFPTIMTLWNAAVCMVRISMLLFYIRIFSISGWKPLFWVFVGLNASSLVAVILGALLICRPIEYSYNKMIPGGHCGDLLALQRFTAIWNLLMDTAVVALPMPILWGLKLNLRKKIGLSFVLGMGAIICLMTLTRVFISAYYELDNVTKQNGIVAFITGLEPIIGITNACMPFFPAVLRHISHSDSYRGLSQLFKSQPTAMSKGSNPSGGSWGLSTPQINSRPRKDMSDFVSLDDDTTELTGIKVRQDISIVESGLARSDRSSA